MQIAKPKHPNRAILRNAVRLDDPHNSTIPSSLVVDPWRAVENALTAKEKLELAAIVAQRVLPPMQLRIFQAQFGPGMHVTQRKLAAELEISLHEVRKFRRWSVQSVRKSYPLIMEDIMIERFVSSRKHPLFLVGR